MFVKDELKIIEFNVCFGDLEVMNVLLILKCFFVEIGEEIVDGNLKGVEFEWKVMVVKYIVLKGYLINLVRGIKFYVDEVKIREEGVRVYYVFFDENFRMFG